MRKLRQPSICVEGDQDGRRLETGDWTDPFLDHEHEEHRMEMEMTVAEPHKATFEGK